MLFQAAIFRRWKSRLCRLRAQRRRRHNRLSGVADIETLEVRMLLSGIPANVGAPAVDIVTGDPNDWAMFNRDPGGTRYNFAEHILGPESVGDLQVKWKFETAGPVAGTPAVVNDRVYTADATGVVYALDRHGQLLWQTTLGIGPTIGNIKVNASALVTNRTVVIGDQSGRIHGLDVETGTVKWTSNPNPHPFAAIWGSPTMVGNYVAIGTSSNEWVVPAIIPGYAPTFRGSLVLLDPGNGDVVWQTFTISEEENAAGASGASIWGTPTYDRASNTLFAGTSNNYSQPTTGTSDALIAFDASDGQIKWVNQRTADDEWTFAFGDSTDAHPDFDIGDSPQVYKLNGRTVVSFGQKSGFFHVLDAATGEEISAPIQLAPSGTIGGLFVDSAYANGVVFVNGTDWPAPLFGSDPPNGGILSAVAADGSHELWRFETPFSPNISGVAVANGVVYFQSALNGQLYALDAATGDVLAQVTTGGLSSGPAVSRGQIYLGTGDAAFTFLDPTLPLLPGGIVALGLPDGPGSPGALTPASALDEQRLTLVLVDPSLSAASRNVAGPFAGSDGDVGRVPWQQATGPTRPTRAPSPTAADGFFAATAAEEDSDRLKHEASGTPDKDAWPIDDALAELLLEGALVLD